MTPRAPIVLLAAGVLAVAVAALALRADGDVKLETSTQIFLVRGDGTGLRKLTSGPESNSFFSWSPNGRQIAHTSPRGIVITDPSGSSRRVVTRAHGCPAWSPTRREIAFFTSRRRTAMVRTVCADGSHPRTLTTRRKTGFVECLPAWSPNGERVVYAERRVKRTVPVVAGPVDLVVVSRHGSRDRIRIGGEESRPQWSPDGHSILFSRRRPPAGGTGLWIVSPKGGALRPLIRGALGGVQAAWSPDSRSVAFTGAFTGTGGNHLYVVPADGGSKRQVVADGATQFAPSWSPDGSQLAFADFDGHIRVVRPDGSGDHAIATLSNGEFFDLAWSPDGRWVAFAADERPRET